MEGDMNFENDEQKIKGAATEAQSASSVPQQPTAPTAPTAQTANIPRAPKVEPVSDGQETITGGGYTGFGGTTGTEADSVGVGRPTVGFVQDTNTRLRNGRIVAPNDTVRRDANGNAVGESRSQYGAYTRIVNQGTGAVRWEMGGKAVEAPASMRMLGGNDGADSSLAYYNRQAWRAMKEENKNRIRANYNLSVGESLVDAYGDLRGKIGKTDGIVKGADGSQYHEASIRADELGSINKKNLGMGAYDSISRVYVRQRVDNEGNPIVGADGKSVAPDFIVEFVKDGNKNGGVGEKWTRRFNAGQVARIMSDGYQKGSGMSEAEAHVNTVRQMGMNPLDWADAKDAYDKNREEMKLKYAKMNNDFKLGVYKNAADIVSSMSGGRKDVSKMSNGELAPAIIKTLLSDEKFIGNLGNVQRTDDNGNPVLTMDANGNEVPDMVWDQQTFANNLNGLIEQVRGQSGRFAEVAGSDAQNGSSNINPVETFDALVRAMGGKEADYPGIMQAIQQVTGALPVIGGAQEQRQQIAERATVSGSSGSMEANAPAPTSDNASAPTADNGAAAQSGVQDRQYSQADIEAARAELARRAANRGGTNAAGDGNVQNSAPSIDYTTADASQWDIGQDDDDKTQIEKVRHLSNAAKAAGLASNGNGEYEMPNELVNHLSSEDAAKVRAMSKNANGAVDYVAAAPGYSMTVKANPYGGIETINSELINLARKANANKAAFDKEYNRRVISEKAKIERANPRNRAGAMKRREEALNEARERIKKEMTDDFRKNGDNVSWLGRISQEDFDNILGMVAPNTASAAKGIWLGDTEGNRKRREEAEERSLVNESLSAYEDAKKRAAKEPDHDKGIPKDPTT